MVQEAFLSHHSSGFLKSYKKTKRGIPESKIIAETKNSLEGHNSIYELAKEITSNVNTEQQRLHKTKEKQKKEQKKMIRASQKCGTCIFSIRT